MADKWKDCFLSQANACDRLGSPFTARLCRILPDLFTFDTAVAARVRDWPGNPVQDALALRLCGGLHALVLSGKDADLAAAYPPNDVTDAALRAALATSIARHDIWLCESLERAPQTNEVARAAMLLPGFLAIGRAFQLPLAVREIGSSGGLNLLFDRFDYRYGEARAGDPASTVQLAPEIRGKAPPLSGSLDIASRAGSDIAPIDVSRPAERLRLASYVWADQTARLQRQAAAVSLATAGSVTVQKSDAIAFVARELAVRPVDAVFVLFHSIMWQYMPETSRASIEAMLNRAGNDAGAPVAWLRMEPLAGDAYATLRLTLWPHGETRDLAHCDFHGRWIEWIAD